MHHCLLIPEILGLICSEIPEYSNRDLISLAQTSRSFQEPALYRLWYEIDTVEPLIRCMPRDLWEVRGTKLVFKRAITQSDWMVFKKYARYVRVFNLTDTLEPILFEPISPKEYQILSMAAGGRVMLPNITDFSCYCTEENLPFIHHFLGPNLTTFKIWTRETLPPSHLSVFADFGTQHPALTVVTAMMKPEATEVLSAIVCQWNNLRCLNAGVISSDALVHIAKLPSLQELTLTDEGHGNMPVDFPYDLPFVSLRKLVVSSPSFLFCIRLITSIYPGVSLQSIVCCANHSHLLPTSTEWKNLLKAITRTCLHSSLLNISVYDQLALSNRPDHYPSITKDHLRLLFPFTDLDSVTLETAGIFDINDTTMEELAVAWPKLRHLYLTGDVTFESTITLAGLLPLAKYCSKLNFLALAIDATSVPLTEPGPRSHSLLRELRVFNSPINSSGCVAAFLSDIFPCLEIVAHWDSIYVAVASDDDQTPRPNLWREVTDLVERSASVRARGNFIEE